MSTTDLTAEDLFHSLTGYDEIAINKAFGEDLSELRKHPFMFMRALIFVHLRRGAEAVKDSDAHQQAMNLTMSDLEGYFDQDTEVMADEPVTEAGKGDTPSS